VSEGCEGSPSILANPEPCLETINSEGSEQSEVSEGSLEVIPKPTILEVLERLRPSMIGGFTEEKLLAKIMSLGFDREEAQKRVNHFKQGELIVQDDVGNWFFKR